MKKLALFYKPMPSNFLDPPQLKRKKYAQNYLFQRKNPKWCCQFLTESSNVLLCGNYKKYLITFFFLGALVKGHTFAAGCVPDCWRITVAS